MRKQHFSSLLLLFLACFIYNIAVAHVIAPTKNSGPDSVYLFSYTPNENTSRNPICFAWSRDKVTWFSIGNEHGFLRSDFGRWGSEKKIFSPFLVRSKDGIWHSVWSLNDYHPYFAVASSPDLINWESQIYPKLKDGQVFLKPVISYDKPNENYLIKFLDKGEKTYQVVTKDFKIFSVASAIPAVQYQPANTEIQLNNRNLAGQVHRVSWETIEKMKNEVSKREHLDKLHAETTKDDNIRFKDLKTVEVTITPQNEKAKSISDLLIGAFFEDINYAADGGLYAELIQNRGFEYHPSDNSYRNKDWNSSYSWSLKGDGTKFFIDSTNPVHENNKHFAVLHTRSAGASLMNSGFDGISLEKGASYQFSVFGKLSDRSDKKLLVQLVDKEGSVLAKSTINLNAASWKKYTAILAPTKAVSGASLMLQPLSEGVIQLDMVSLFPKNTFKGRKNGLRNDLAVSIANIKPKFIRFPGGCVAHGDGIGNIYHWKNTIGPLEARKPQRNLWGYHQSMGLGYFEYFQFCEDIGAAPLPVVAAGVPCQNSGTGGPGQQGGIPMDEMDEYIQDILDLVEWANGGTNTKWGKIRAAAGHPKPFNLKYIGIGNEDLISNVFEERFTMIYNAVKAKHPEITVIGTVGPFFEGSDYVEGWKLADKLKVPMVDEHYYLPPGWFIYNQDFYDKYDRNKSKVYLGEYASHLPGRPNNLETALSEALYLTAVERNGDVVTMTSYAPLLAKEHHTQWSPDLIYFNNDEIKPTVGYYVQELYGNNAGTKYIPANISVSDNSLPVKSRVGVSIVQDEKSKDIILKMVNMLPVKVLANIDLAKLGVKQQGARTVLTGSPASRTEKPVTSDYKVPENNIEELPPYSFTVIRLQTK